MDDYLDQEKSPVVAALLAIVPGLGHAYLKDIFYCILYFIVFWVALIASIVYFKGFHYYQLVFILIWAYGIYDAYTDALELNKKSAETSSSESETE
ncbi:MAG: hypothetical protein D6805_08685 [Planctomycetota bacterium]|nr:MAG: hypothetical protein D6805_08685 [Planctomycetota bacterium]